MVVNAPVNIGLDEKQVGQRLKPLDDKLEIILARTAREKGVEIAPLRATLVQSWARLVSAMRTFPSD